MSSVVFVDNKGIEPTGGGGNGDVSSGAATGAPQLSPSVVVIIVLITVVFFLSGFLHLLARCFARPPPRGGAARRHDSSGSLTSLQGQLQQLFHLHDAGVEQSFIEALPVFFYRSVRGLKGGAADCAVCLAEFAADDRLRLLPKCSHAFHVDCIDTWLLSHSTCPLCRCSLLVGPPDSSAASSAGASAFRVDSFGRVSSGAAVSSRASSRVNSFAAADAGSVASDDAQPVETAPGQRPPELVVPVKLGRLCPLTGNADGGDSGNCSYSMNRNASRRSYSMGSYEYVLDPSALGGEQQTAMVVIAPTPVHRKLKPPGTPGHRSVASECIAEEAAMTVDVGDSKPAFWARWRRPASAAASSDGCRSTSDLGGKSFSFRLPLPAEGPEERAFWWWKSGAAGAAGGAASRASFSESQRWEGGSSVCSTTVEMKSNGSAASSAPSIARRTLRWLLRRERTAPRAVDDDALPAP